MYIGPYILSRSTERNGVAKPQEHCSQISGEHGAEIQPLDNQSNLRKPDTENLLRYLWVRLTLSTFSYLNVRYLI